MAVTSTIRKNSWQPKASPCHVMQRLYTSLRRVFFSDVFFSYGLDISSKILGSLTHKEILRKKTRVFPKSPKDLSPSPLFYAYLGHPKGSSNIQIIKLHIFNSRTLFSDQKLWKMDLSRIHRWCMQRAICRFCWSLSIEYKIFLGQSVRTATSIGSGFSARIRGYNFAMRKVYDAAKSLQTNGIEIIWCSKM